MQPPVSNTIQQRALATIERELGIDFIEVDAISELFPMLSDPTLRIDVITLPLSRLVDAHAEADAFDMINTLSTLIKCTVYRNGIGKPVRRETKICLLVGDITDPKLIRQAILMPDIFLGTLLTEKWGYELVKENLKRTISGDYSIPKHVLDLLKPKKSIVCKKNTIDLTPREEQILKLICDRGATNKVIAKMLDISESTVKLHVGKVLKKYGCKNRTQLALFSKRFPLTNNVQGRLPSTDSDALPV
jgi:DNA-binding CsgD family transcriptional regulator